MSKGDGRQERRLASYTPQLDAYRYREPDIDYNNMTHKQAVAKLIREQYGMEPFDNLDDKANDAINSFQQMLDETFLGKTFRFTIPQGGATPSTTQAVGKVQQEIRRIIEIQKSWDGLWKPAGRAALHISDMDSVHLDNAILFLQRNLAEIDKQIGALAEDIAHNPSLAENNAAMLTAYAVRQVRVETIIAQMQEEQEHRGTSVNLKKKVRGSFLDIEPTVPEVKTEDVDKA